MDLRRILLIIGFVLVVVGIGFGLYFTFFRATPGPSVEEPGTVTEGPRGGLEPADVGAPTGTPVSPTQPPVIRPGVAEVADGGLTQVRAVAPTTTIGASLSSSGALSYYDRSSGRFYRLLPDGTPSELSSRQFTNVSAVTFAPSGTSAILEYPDGANIYYDFASGRQATLPSHWEEFEFSDDGSDIAAKSIGTDESNRFLVVSNPDGSGARAVQELGANADKVTVAFSPTGQSVALAETGKMLGPTTREVHFVGQNHENLRSMTVEGLNFVPQWAPDGKQLLYSTSSAGNDYKPTLWIVDAYGDDIGRNRRSLAVSTWADKCTFADTATLYCAVPTDLQRGAGLQPSLSDTVPDEIYRIDLDSGLQTRIAIPEGQHTVDTLMLTPDGSKLYFTDKGTGLLNEIRLR